MELGAGRIGVRPATGEAASADRGRPDRPDGGDQGATGTSDGGPTVGGLVWGLLAGVVLVVAQLLRITGTRTWQAFAAEDGAVYYQDLLDDGPVVPLLRGFAGYAQLPNRLLTIPAGLVPLEDVPVYFAVVGSIVTVLLAGCAHRWCRGWISSPVLRLALVVVMVLSPVAADEMTANLVNTIWVFVAVLPWALIARQEGRADTAGRAVVAFLAATATGVAFAFVPLAVGWAWLRRTRSALVVAAAYGVGLVVQGAVMSTATDAQPAALERPLVPMAEIVALRTTAAPLFGHEAARTLWDDHGNPFLAVGVLLVVAALAFAAIGARPAAQVLAATLVATAVGIVAVLVWARGTVPFEFFELGRIYPFGHPRYSYLPSVLLTGALGVLLSQRIEPDGGGAVLGRVVVVGWVAVLVASSFTQTGYRSESPVWSEGLEAAARRCRAEHAGADDPVLVQQDASDLRSIRLTCGDVIEAVGADP